MEYRSFSDLSRLILNNIDKLPSNIDLVVGIPRSGMLVANYIALIINKPISDIDGFINDKIMKCGRTKNISNNVQIISDCKNVLVVDDSVSTGQSIQECRKKLQGYSSVNFIYCAPYVISSSRNMVDIYFEIVNQPRVFEWNLFHHVSVLDKTLFDMDGVLCKDPTLLENDDGENYKQFLLNAKPKIIPSCQIGGIVTSRLEKYRDETELWLCNNQVKYKELIMLNATAQERVQNQLHGKFKAEIYKNSKALLFIESSQCQAEEIYKITNKAVYCLENNTFYNGGKLYELRFEKKAFIKNILRKCSFIMWIYKYIQKLLYANK